MHKNSSMGVCIESSRSLIDFNNRTIPMATMPHEVRLIVKQSIKSDKQPTSLDSSCLAKVLRSGPHLIAVRPPGRPFLLVLCRVCRGINKAFFVEKGSKTKMTYAATLFFHDDLYAAGVVFDGVMTVDGVYNVLDVTFWGKNNIINVALPERLAMATHFLTNLYVHDDLAPCDFATIQHWHYEDIDTAQEDASRDQGSMLVFRPMFRRFDDVTLKKAAAIQEEPSDGELAGFWAARLPRPDTYVLFDGPTGPQGLRRRMGVDTMERSKAMVALMAGRVGLESRVCVTCRYSGALKTWALFSEKSAQKTQGCMEGQ
jgi:hypothetical protein